MGNRNFYACILLFIGATQVCFAQNHKKFQDSIGAIVANLDKDSIKAITFYDAGIYAFEPLNDLALSRSYIDSSMHFSKISETPDFVAKCHFMYGLISRYEGNYNQALSHLDKNVEHFKNDSISKTYGLFQIAAIHSIRGDFEKSLKIFYEISKIFEHKKDSFALASALNNIGILYYQMDKNDEALNYLENSLSLFKQLDAKRDVANMYRNIGELYLTEKDTLSGINYFEKSLEIANSIKENYAIGYSLYYLGVAYSNSSPNEGISYLVRAEKIIANGNYKKLLAGIRTALGDCQKNLNNPDNAIQYYNSALELSEELELDWRKRVYDGLSSVYVQVGNYEYAYQYLSKKNKLKDSLLNVENLKTINQLKEQFETEKKENELLKLNKQKQEDDIIITTQNRKVKQLTLGLGGAGMLGILGFLLFKQRLQNKKQNELLLAISETQSAERKRISQDLHDSIGGSLALTKNKLQNALGKVKETPPEMDEAMDALNSTSDQVRQISHNLMPGELVRFGLVPAINTLLEQLNKEELHAQLYTTQMENRIEPLKEIQLYRIVQEAIQNVLKHAKAKNLYIHLTRHKQHLNVLIEDDGIGMLPNIKEGLGLKNIEQRIKMLNGSFTLDSSENKGTTLNIQIPV